MIKAKGATERRVTYLVQGFFDFTQTGISPDAIRKGLMQALKQKGFNTVNIELSISNADHPKAHPTTATQDLIAKRERQQKAEKRAQREGELEVASVAPTEGLKTARNEPKRAKKRQRRKVVKRAQSTTPRKGGSNAKTHERTYK